MAGPGRAGTVALAGLIARELGGSARARLVAAAGTATMPVLLAVDHLKGPTAFDVLAWAGLAPLAARVGRTGDQRWWVAAGAVPGLGLGLANKHSIGLFVVAVVVRLLLSGGQRAVCNRWFVLGAVVAGRVHHPGRGEAGRARRGHDRDDPQAQ